MFNNVFQCLIMFFVINDINFFSNYKIMSGTPEESKPIGLQLGDIIKIDAPGDETLHNKSFFIRYIDTQFLRLENREGERLLSLIDGRLETESITEIILLDRQKYPGYARQVGLLPNKLVDIYIGGPNPFQISGQIKGLVNDQIEVLTSEHQTLYIDFAYKGIPLDIPIVKINIREENMLSIPVTDGPATTPGTDGPATTPVTDGMYSQEDSEPIVFRADEIEIGEVLGSLKHVVDLPDSEKRFHIDKQTDDMMNNMLSTIPNVGRERNIINDIHTMINRFKELREEFSELNKNDNILKPIKYDDNTKPLVEVLEKLENKLYWLLPVATMKKKLYDLEDTIEDETVEEVQLALEQLKLQNKTPKEKSPFNYREYLKATREFSTPFIKNDSFEHNIHQEINTPITAIINNSKDFETSVANDKFGTSSKRFFTQEYSIAQDIIQNDEQGGRLVKATPNDSIAVNSFVTLPEATVIFSKINQPTTHVMTQIGLNDNFLQYWQVLRNKTKRTNIEVSICEPQNASNEQFFNGITHYSPKRNNEDNSKTKKMTNQEMHRQYLQNFVPSTEKLFDEVKHQIIGSVSVHTVVGYLQPFGIHSNNITVSRYNNMRAFVAEQINDFHTKLFKSRALNFRINNELPKVNGMSGIRLMFSNSIDTYDKMLIGYGISSSTHITDDELYSRAMAIDQAKFLNACIGMISARLSIINDLPCAAFVRDRNNVQSEPDECSKYILAKKYLSIAELEGGNDTEVFFDKRYDNTFYDLVNEYTASLENVEEGEPRKLYLAERLQEVNGLAVSDAMRDADAMLSGKKKVITGDYAVLIAEDTDPRYYRRENEKWVFDKSVEEGLITDETKLFCNFNDKCISNRDGCSTMETTHTNIESEFEKQIIREFDAALKSTNDAYIKKTVIDYKNAEKNVHVLRGLLYGSSMTLTSENKYNPVFEEHPSIETERSPYERLREAILGKSDFAKKQQDISSFISYFTRDSKVKDGESEWWLYCNKTNVKLLPSFYRQISTSFINGTDYNKVIDDICDERGKKGDDGSLWVDKHSGYTITQLSFDAQEYTEDGKRVNNLPTVSDDDDETNEQEQDAMNMKYTDEDTRLIMRVVKDMGKFMNIDLNLGKTFIIRHAKDMQIFDEKKYNSQLKLARSKNPNKNFPTHTEYKNDILVTMTLSYLLIYIQTSIPEIKHGRQYPGCKRSFRGLPMGKSDKGIEYIACVANKIKRTVEPWNMKSKRKNVVNNIKKHLDTVAVKRSEIKTLIENKRLFIAREKDHIQERNKIEQVRISASFLPLLFPVDTPEIVSSPKEFFDASETAMRSSDKQQNLHINAMQGKKIFVAVRMQYVIEKAIKNTEAVLRNATDKPYLENACCWVGDHNPFEYFSKKEHSIQVLNNESKIIRLFLNKAKKLSSARILFVPGETKKKFPKISSIYSESTIYRAFATLCSSDVNEEHPTICRNSDAVEDGDIVNVKKTIADKIDDLKKSEFKYSATHIMDLLASLNINNTFAWKHDDEPTAQEFSDKTFSQFLQSKDKISIIQSTINISKDAIKKNLQKKEVNHYNKAIDSISAVFDHNEIDVNFNEISFSSKCLRYVCLVFPTMLSSIVNYPELHFVPKHWDLSHDHQSDIEKFVEKKLEPIRDAMKTLNKHSIMNETVKAELKNIKSFFDIALAQNEISVQDLFEFCLFKSLNVYINSLGSVNNVNSSNVANADFVKAMIFFINKDIGNVITNYTTIEKKITKSKENEKMNILRKREKMDDEEREIDNQKKFNKLGDEWGRGLQKSLIEYDGDLYDKERNDTNVDSDTPNGDLPESDQAEIDRIVMPDDDEHPEGMDGDY